MRVLAVLAPLATIGSAVIATVLRVKSHRRPRPDTVAERRTKTTWTWVFVALFGITALSLAVLAAANFSVSS